jgi:hypothetical protein
LWKNDGALYNTVVTGIVLVENVCVKLVKFCEFSPPVENGDQTLHVFHRNMLEMCFSVTTAPLKTGCPVEKV